MSQVTTVTRLDFPISDLPVGDIMPPMDFEHPTWPIVDGWEDSLCPKSGFGLPSGKQRIDTPNGPAIRFAPSRGLLGGERALMAGEQAWADCSVRCVVEPIQIECDQTMDTWFSNLARVGIVLRAETSRRFYWFGVEGRRQLVLYRRDDEDWRPLAMLACPDDVGRVTLEATITGDRIEAHCPELDASFDVRDSTFANGRCGVRSVGESLLYELSVQCSSEVERTWIQLDSSLPDAVKVGEIRLKPGQQFITAAPMTSADQHDLLIWERERIFATDWSGNERWSVEGTFNPTHAYVGSQRVYLMAGKMSESESTVNVRGQSHKQVKTEAMVVLDGTNGKQITRVPIPADPDMDLVHVRGSRVSNSKDDFAFEVGTSIGPGSIDFIYRRDHPGGRCPVWAYDAQGNLLWYRRVRVPYGHHNSIHIADIDGDGRREVLAGAACFAEDGTFLWEQEHASEMLHIAGAVHYDATVVQEPARYEGDEPVTFMVGGSAGVYVADATDGKTLAIHRIGHAQWGIPMKVRDDLPGRQILCGTRWGNMGIMSLLTNRGERLWTIQPDYIAQGTCAVQWNPQGAQHIWVNTTRHTQGLYDGYGRMVSTLEPIREIWGNREARQVKSMALKRTPADAQNTLGIVIDDAVHLFEPG